LKLTAIQVKQAKPEDEPYKLSDGKGMYLRVMPGGAKYWRYKYRFAGKEKLLSLGVYPEVTLAEARTRLEQARRLKAEGKDPSAEKKTEKLTQRYEGQNTFEAVAKDWYETKISDKSESHKDRTWRILSNDLLPSLGTRPVAQISSQELLAVLRKVEARGAVDMAHRAKQTAGHVFRFAVATGRADRDPSADLKGALRPKTKKHYAAITDPSEVGKLLVAIDEFRGMPSVSFALRLSPYLFQRPGEIRSMEWDEINWEQERWEIPASKMKMREPHIVPLARQSIELLKAIFPLTGRGQFVFPGARGASRPISDNSVRVALRTIGYGNETMTPHGFRAMARTILDEVLKVRVDYIEHQLAHIQRDPNGRSYNRTKHVTERAEMMQSWADYLDELRDGALGSFQSGEEPNVVTS